MASDRAVLGHIEVIDPQTVGAQETAWLAGLAGLVDSPDRWPAGQGPALLSVHTPQGRRT